MNTASNQAWDALCDRASRRNLLERVTFPDRKLEAWRYTPLHASLAKIVWKDAASFASSSLEEIFEEYSLDGALLLASDSIVFFANGQEVKAHTRFSSHIKISDESSKIRVDLQEHFSYGLNAALCTKGVHLRVPAGVDAGRLVLIHYHEGDDISTHLRHSIELEEGAKLTILDLHIGKGRYFSNPVFDVHCAKNAHLRHVKRQADSLEAFHLGFVCAVIDERGNYDSFTLNQGSLLARHEVVSILSGEHANTNVNAVQLVDGMRLNDLTSMIHHSAPACTSRQTVRTVLDAEGQGVFQGKILVDQIAQKTDGYQMNQALLLSEKAQINSKPELEIYADDVKCSHGATVGALDEEQLFYLRSRGITGQEARAILVQAFLREAIELLEDEELQEFLLKHLPENFLILE